MPHGAQFTAMHLLLILWALLVVTDAQSPCDPETQYLREDRQCCKKCGPGTSMVSKNSCEEPQCKPCGENEYQDTYTTSSMCKSHPYCDPNKNFIFVTHKSKTQPTTCTCKEGYHCSREKCIICVQHTECQGGYKIVFRGNHSHDTVCVKCPPNTFSSSMSEDCKKWTRCKSGYQVKENGTSTSDTVCEPTPRRHAALIPAIVIVLALIGIVAVLGICLHKLKGTGDAEGRVKGCVELCLGGTKKPVAEHLLTTGTYTVVPETETPSQDVEAKTPEENEVEEPSDDGVLTENGNVVAQEDGKREIISRQESQTPSYQSETV